MFTNPFAKYNPFKGPFGAAMKRSRNLFGTHTTPREWKHGARDIPFGMGAASLYVDGTDGHDSNDGESWKTAKATIQEAIDTADSWTQIYVAADTYAENVLIPTTKRDLALIGESRDTVIIHPTDGYPLRIQAPNTAVHNCSLFLEEITKYCAYVQSDRCLLDTINVDGVANSSGIKFHGSEGTILRRLYAVNSNLIRAVDTTGTASHIEISDCIIDISGSYGIYFDSISKSKIFDNNVNVTGYCVYLAVAATDNAVFHNCLVDPRDHGTNNTFFENFYSGHTNINNGHGCATEPFTFTNNTDPRPAICCNCWNANGIFRTLLRKKTAAQTTQAATNANGTTWVDLKTIAPTTSDIELYQLKMTVAGTWAGNAKYRIIIGTTKVYPFPADKNISTGVLESLIFPINIQINETAKIQFRSDNAGDGAGDTVTLDQLDYATVL